MYVLCVLYDSMSGLFAGLMSHKARGNSLGRGQGQAAQGGRIHILESLLVIPACSAVQPSECEEQRNKILSVDRVADHPSQKS